MRMRDVRPRMKEHGVEKGTIMCLEELAEQQSVMKQQMVEMAKQMISIINSLQSVVVVGERMKQAVEDINKKYGDREDD